MQVQDEWYVADGIAEDTDSNALRPLQQGSIIYRIAFGPRAGREVLTLREAMPVETNSDYGPTPLCANEQGFSLHAAVRCHANERLELERLCRYITLPALANDRIKINAKGQVDKAKDAVARWHHASRTVAVGVYATACGIGATATASPNPISRCLGTECEAALEGSTTTAKRHQSIASSSNQRARPARTRSANAFGLDQTIEAGVQLKLNLLPALWWRIENHRIDRSSAKR